MAWCIKYKYEKIKSVRNNGARNLDTPEAVYADPY
jgi:hypothetical protein